MHMEGFVNIIAGIFFNVLKTNFCLKHHCLNKQLHLRLRLLAWSFPLYPKPSWLLKPWIKHLGSVWNSVQPVNTRREAGNSKGAHLLYFVRCEEDKWGKSDWIWPVGTLAGAGMSQMLAEVRFAEVKGSFLILASFRGEDLGGGARPRKHLLQRRGFWALDILIYF